MIRCGAVVGCSQEATRFLLQEASSQILYQDSGRVFVCRCAEHAGHYAQFLEPGKAVLLREISREEAVVYLVQKS